MAVFETWTVLPHQPIEKLSENLWSVPGTLPRGDVRRRMNIVRLKSGELIIYNGIALSEAEMADIEAFGKPAYLIVPNAFHRQDSKIFKQRYPQIKVLCPAGAAKKVKPFVAVDGSFDDAPGDDTVSLTHLRGLKQAEGVICVRSSNGTSLIFCDAVLNLPKLGGMMGFFLAPTGTLSVPRAVRWMFMKNKRQYREHLEELAAFPDLTRVIVGHGPTLTEQPSSELRRAAGAL